MRKYNIKLKAMYKTESKLRKQLHKQGLILKKSYKKNTSNADDLGNYMIVDENTNAVVAGSRWELTLEDVERYLQE